MSGSFRDEVRRLPDQLRAAPRVLGDPGPLAGPGRLLIAGLGGSAMAGEFLALLLPPEREVLVVRDAALPAWAGPGDPVLCLSCSGRTVETLSVWDGARERGLFAGAVASGGALLDRARSAGAPAALVPGGLAPRSSLGHLLRGAAALALGGVDPGWEEAAGHLERVRDRWGGGDPEGDPAADLARRLEGRLPVILADEPHLRAAARRWAADLAENAEVPAVVWDLPEASHNAVMAVAADAPDPLPLTVLALGRPRGAASRRRWDALLGVLADHGAAVIDVLEPHAVPWIEALGLAYAGDWVSTALAGALGVDAAGLSLMNDLKRRLADGAGDTKDPTV